jgi:DNA-binding MarR family transcriptional regulator
MSDQPATRTKDQDMAAQVATLLHSDAIHLLRRLRREDEALGLSAARLSALSVVGFAGPHTLGALAAAEQVTPPTMSRIVDALEAEGLVTREGDARDGRLSRIRITHKGRRILDRGRARRTARLAGRLRGLPPEELDALARGVRVLNRVLTEPW